MGDDASPDAARISRASGARLKPPLASLGAKRGIDPPLLDAFRIFYYWRQ